MIQEINLEEILSLNGETESHDGYWWYTNESIIKSMKEACFQVLDVASENAEAYTYGAAVCADKDSILQIKDWII